MSPLPTDPPRLLVSVRSASEAADALAGGCDILDLKEPSRGSLGRVDRDVIEATIVLRDRLAPTVPVSAALGELNEWADLSCELPAGLNYVKVGLAGMRSHADWRQAWLTLHANLTKGPAAVEWILVAYADADRADAPEPEAVLAAAGSLPCRGVLIDTWDKHDGRLWNRLEEEQLRDYARQCHERGRWLAVAGRLAREEIPRVLGTGADIIAVRSAACSDQDRTGTIDRAAVRRLKSCFPPQ